MGKENFVPPIEENNYCTKDIVFRGKSVLKKRTILEQLEEAEEKENKENQ